MSPYHVVAVGDQVVDCKTKLKTATSTTTKTAPDADRCQLADKTPASITITIAIIASPKSHHLNHVTIITTTIATIVTIITCKSPPGRAGAGCKRKASS